MAYSPFCGTPSFFAISDFSISRMMILPFQVVEKSVPLQIWHSLPRTKTLHFLHAFFFAIYFFAFSFFSSFLPFFFSSSNHFTFPRWGWRMVSPIFGLEMSLKLMAMMRALQKSPTLRTFFDSLPVSVFCLLKLMKSSIVCETWIIPSTAPRLMNAPKFVMSEIFPLTISCISGM